MPLQVAELVWSQPDKQGARPLTPLGPAETGRFYIPGPDEGQMIGEEHESQSTRAGMTIYQLRPQAGPAHVTADVMGLAVLKEPLRWSTQCTHPLCLSCGAVTAAVKRRSGTIALERSERLNSRR
ncbi:unnamed protein product [Gadus morhua 'NCC']